VVADRVHQVRLAEADATVDEQRLYARPGSRRLHRRGAGELVALALDEISKREIRFKRPPICGSATSRFTWHPMSGETEPPQPRQRVACRSRRSPACRRWHQFLDQLTDPRGAVLVHQSTT